MRLLFTKRRIIWVTKDGSKIFVKDLTEEHAKNILRMIIRKKTERVQYYDDYDDYDDDHSECIYDL